MREVDFSYGSFNINFKDGNKVWYLAIHPEMYPVTGGIKPSGNYFVYCIHPIRGSVFFIVEQDLNCKWFCDRKPPYFSDKFIEWIGTEIETFSR